MTYGARETHKSLPEAEVQKPKKAGRKYGELLEAAAASSTPAREPDATVAAAAVIFRSEFHGLEERIAVETLAIPLVAALSPDLRSETSAIAREIAQETRRAMARTENPVRRPIRYLATKCHDREAIRERARENRVEKKRPRGPPASSRAARNAAQLAKLDDNLQPIGDSG